MAYRFNTYCPYFVEGACNNNCKYKYHIRCNANLTCFNPKCQYGHTISFNFRKLFKQIVNENLNDEYENSKNRCFFSINCLNTNCHNVHMINKESMGVINHMLSKKISYEDSFRIYTLHLKNTSILPLPYNPPIDNNTPEQQILFVDPVLEDNLLKLTETDDTITHQSNDSEDVKLKFLQELMVCQKNIKLMSREVYNKDIVIFNLMKEKQLLEDKICKDKLKTHYLIGAIRNMENR